MASRQPIYGNLYIYRLLIGTLFASLTSKEPVQNIHSTTCKLNNFSKIIRTKIAEFLWQMFLVSCHFTSLLSVQISPNPTD